MANAPQVSKKQIELYVKRNEGIVVQNAMLVLPVKDSKKDTGKKATQVKPETIAEKERARDEAREAPLEQLVKKRVKQVAESISGMGKIVPSESFMYCLPSREMMKLSVLTLESTSTAHDYNTLGVFDKRLGCLEEGKTCLTCCRSYADCEGHAGYIPFSTRFIHPMFQQEAIYSLQCTCTYCGHVYATEDFIREVKLHRLTGLNYLKQLAAASGELQKLHKHPNFTRDIYESNMVDHKILYRKHKSGELYRQDIEVIKGIFDNYNETDLKILRWTGKTVPSSFIADGTLVIQPQLRLPGFVNGKTTDHYLTLKYVDLIKFNAQLRNNKKMNDWCINQVLATQYSRFKEIFFGPETKGLAKASDKGSGLLELFGKKEGLLRKHAMGKRVNHCGRAVANPGVNDYGKIGIPRFFASTLLVEEVVTRYNKKRISTAIEAGQKYVHVTVMIDGSPVKYILDEKRRKKSNFKLEIGHIVERPIEDGDIVLCGRQPTLHAPSIMGFVCYLTDKDVIELHSSNDGPMNCDYDGDELTIHVIRTISGIVEAMTCASTLNHLMNEQANRAMIGAAFHALLGAYLMTKGWKYLTYDEFDEDEWREMKENIKKEAMLEDEFDEEDWDDNLDKSLKEKKDELLKDVAEREVKIPEYRWKEAISIIKDSHRKSTLIRRCTQHGVDYLSGRGLASIVFPVNLTYKGSGVEIIDGILVKGILRKSNIGTGDASLVKVICKLFSLDEGNRFIDEIAKITDWFIMWHGFSVGQHTFSTNRKAILNKTRNEVNKIQGRFYNLGPMSTGVLDSFFWKRRAHGMLNHMQSIGKEIGNSYLIDSNGLVVLGKGGAEAKGSDSNTGQITSCLGCQNVKSDLQVAELNGGTRRLPMFLPGDCSLEAHGFVMKSFYDGISPASLWWHMTSSREGLVDTAASTSDIGYTHRRIIKALEDILIDSRGMVSSISGRIIQFSFDGMNTALQMFLNSPETGKTLSFCDFKALATMVNGLYAYIKLNRPEMGKVLPVSEVFLEKCFEELKTKESFIATSSKSDVQRVYSMLNGELISTVNISGKESVKRVISKDVFVEMNKGRPSFTPTPTRTE